jgi:hypothetical protein
MVLPGGFRVLTSAELGLCHAERLPQVADLCASEQNLPTTCQVPTAIAALNAMAYRHPMFHWCRGSKYIVIDPEFAQQDKRPKWLRQLSVRTQGQA